MNEEEFTVANIQFYFAMGVPTFFVLFGIILNRADASSLRSAMIALRDSIHRDMISFHERVAVVEERNKDR